MRYLIGLIATSVLTAFSYGQSPDVAIDPRLNGVWIVETTEMNGQLVEGFNGSTFRIDGRSLTWTVGQRKMDRKLIIDRSVTPCQFDQTIVKQGSENKTVLVVQEAINVA
jgi:hypothetical protein